jgi:hypothetical protein
LVPLYLEVTAVDKMRINLRYGRACSSPAPRRPQPVWYIAPRESETNLTPQMILAPKRQAAKSGT